MTDLLKSEWIKLRTVRVNYVLTIIAAAIPIVVVTLVAALSSRVQQTADDFAGGVTATLVLTALLLGVVGALNLTSEFSHGTIRVTFAAVPQRRNVLLAKAIVSLLATMVLATIIELVSFGIGAGILSGRGADIALRPSDKAAMASAVLLAGMLSVLGYGIGLLIRNSPATIAVLILWPLLLENLVRAVLSAAGVSNQTPWLPYQSAITMLNPSTDSGDPSRLHGALYLGTIVVVLVAVGIFVNERRDA